ncbi:MAG: hypothetical protein KBE15_07225, partial [Budvicia sp.]|nr:hypothetical protein [Budvicia sp.]
MIKKANNTRSLLNAALARLMPQLSELELRSLTERQDLQQIAEQFILSLSEKIEPLNTSPDLDVKTTPDNESTSWEIPVEHHEPLSDVTEIPAAALPLKPGQIPTQSLTPAIAPKEALMPKANFNFANARVGAAYLSKIESSCHTGEQVTIQEIKFSQDIGITFNP